MKTTIAATLLAAVACSASAAEKITYDDHVLPILKNACLRCHNPDKARGDLDLATFGNLLNGGGSGLIVESGDAGASKLYKVITHEEEPEMPPNGKLDPKEIDIIKRWIAGGLLERSSSSAIKSNKPKMDLSLAGAATGKPEGPPPMPGDLLLDPPNISERGTASTALVASPWSPLVAVGSQRQILLYNTDTYELLGVLPFPEGYPSDAKFSRNGKLLIVGGGRGSHSGMAAVWDITTGERILTVGEDLDSVLAADISSDQRWIAIAGPDKLVKLYSTSTGEQVAKMKKHTGWVTALQFSPDSKYLASGDRAGGIVVWEGDTGQEVNVIGSHKKQVTAIAWRNNKLIMAASEDGYVKTFDAIEGDEIKSTRTHSSGNLHAAIHHNGYVVTAGRDSRIYTWDSNMSRKASISGLPDLPIRVTFTHDFKKVIGNDWTGGVSVWDAASGKKLGSLTPNPPKLSVQMAAAKKRLADLQAVVPAQEKKVKDTSAAVAKARADIANTKKSKEEAIKKLEASLVAVKKAEADAKAAVKSWEGKVAAASTAQKTYNAKKKDRDAKAASLKKFEASLATNQKTSSEKSAALKKAKTDLAAAEKALTAVKTARDSSAAVLAKDDEILKNLNAALAKATERKTKASTSAQGLEKSIAAANAVVKSAQAELGKLRPTIDAVNTDLKKLQSAASAKVYADAQAALKSAKDSATKQAAVAAAANKKVPTEIAKLKKSLTDQVAALEKSMASYAKQETDAKAALANTRAQLGKATTAIARLDAGEAFAKFYHARQDFESRKIDHLKAEARLKDAQSAFQRVDSGLSGVAKALAKKEEEKKALEAQLKKLQSQIDSVKAEAEAATKAASEIGKALKDKENEMSTFEKEFKKRKATIGKKVAAK
ncbi:MAG: hypothetical protein CMO80_19190 [Verrucomicrobiales bacterium]|nr:hypothetical protein [Verrucomicrobiales bacterium]|tara:strand:- start:9368 stop:12028 length:2661 start_codon:yes stop_codon:yes gene_type:complete